MIRPSVPEYIIDEYSLAEVQRVPGSSPGMTFGDTGGELVSTPVALIVLRVANAETLLSSNGA
jgi:hypothetical protein